MNTFQIVLITDGVTSFAMFNYGDMQWTTGYSSGGVDGLGGTEAEVRAKLPYKTTNTNTDRSRG